MKSKVSLWAVAAVGFAGVILLYIYVGGLFKETDAYDNEAVTGIYLDNPPAKPIVISSVEQQRIIDWIKKNNLNKYGEPQNTHYKKGEPLTKNGQTLYVNRFHYIVTKYPNRPWNDGTASDEKALIDKWILANNFNTYGDMSGTAYPGGTPLFNETTGKTTDRYDYIHSQHPDRPWALILTPASASPSE